VHELTPVIGFEVPLSFDGPIDSSVPDTVTPHLLATVREALTNVGRHARATQARVTLSVADGTCRLQVTDDGIGFHGNEVTEGELGLGNLQRRAEKLRGKMVIERPETGGTTLTWEVPLRS
jgi:signal transduction histidine kinase